MPAGVYLLAGEPGMGKSTLAKILIGKEKADNGTVVLGPNTLLGYYAQNQTDAMNMDNTLLATMEDESPAEMRTKLRSILGSLMFSGEDVDKKVSVLSGGERGRLALALLLLHPINFLVLDEPTNHLDLKAKEVLKKAILDYDGTLLVISHDRSFVEGLTDRTIEFRDNKTTEYLGDINYFLEKRKMETFREVEASQKQTAAAKVAPPKVLDSTEKKELDKTEKRIADLEREIKQVNEKMGKDDFYGSSDYEAITKKYQQLQSTLEVEMEKWETLI